MSHRIPPRTPAPAPASHLADESRERERRRENALRGMRYQMYKLEATLEDDKVLAFFKSRGISRATLRPSIVRHERRRHDGRPPAIAFVYTAAQQPVNIKFRSLDKRFWQVAGAEKVLYGLDDITPGTGALDTADALSAGSTNNSNSTTTSTSSTESAEASSNGGSTSTSTSSNGNNNSTSSSSSPSTATMNDSGYDGTVIIVEGEMDKLSCDEAGMRYSVSVPDGAPRQVRDKPLPQTKEEDVKFEYVWNCRQQLDQAQKIILATDNDEPGDALAEELARRLGRDRCWRVRFPPGRKDANDVLIKDGKEALRRLILESAVPYPIAGLLKFSEFADEIFSYHQCRLSDARGASTGWRDLDRLYRVVPGELTIVTGVPNSGKSEFLDALLVNLAKTQGWCFALCSMENKVRDHARKLLEKYSGAPFFDAEYSGGRPRMSPEAIKRGIAWLDKHFSLIRCDDEELPSVDWILNLARAAVMRYGIKGLVIDPYNELDHKRPVGMTETEYVSQMLSRVKRFAQMYEVHVWFVAHPKQMQQWKGEAPQLYDISGSAHFINKCDNGMVVHRNRDPEQGALDLVTLYVRKVRNKAAGNIGEALLRYDRSSGTYEDVIGN